VTANNADTTWPLVQYRIELIMTGIAGLAIPALHQFSYNVYLPVYMLLAIVALSELTIGLHYSPWNLSLLPFKPILKRFNPQGRIPPSVVLNINATIMLILACSGLALGLSAPNWAWLPATLIGTFAMLAGTTGLCPVALTYALVTRNRLHANCIADE